MLNEGSVQHNGIDVGFPFQAVAEPSASAHLDASCHNGSNGNEIFRESSLTEESLFSQNPWALEINPHEGSTLSEIKQFFVASNPRYECPQQNMQQAMSFPVTNSGNTLVPTSPLVHAEFPLASLSGFQENHKAQRFLKNNAECVVI